LAANPTLINGAVITNLAGATFDLQTDNTFTGATSTAAFNNAGTFLKSNSSGVFYFIPAFNNSGTVDVQTGTLFLAGGGTNSTTITVEAGATMGFGTGACTLAANSQVTGAGSVRIGTPNTFDGGVGPFDCHPKYVCQIRVCLPLLAKIL
jgi:hypothetical protein